jgi:glycosyltransferase involved in cell wall biosynthesis
MTLRVAWIRREQDPFSLRVFVEALVPRLERLGIVMQPCREDEAPPTADVLWEPGAGWRLTAPAVRAAAGRMPVLVTIHGLRPFVRPGREDGPDADAVRAGLLRDWTELRERVWVVSPSCFGAEEVGRVYGVAAQRLRVVAHGVDGGLFHPSFRMRFLPSRQPRFFLHVAAWQPVKNTERVFAAYSRLATNRPELLAVLPGYPADRPVPSGVRLLREGLPQERLAELYRQALALVAPSLRETFGLPLLEAMASGCPVITSADSGCREAAGGAALLVNPEDTQNIANALRRIVDEPRLRRSLARRGRARAAMFTWERAAQGYAGLFRELAG